MKRQRQNPAGITLVELLVYLSMAVVVAMVLTSFMVSTLRQRVQVRQQQLAQENARRVVERLSIALRGAYSVQVRDEGEQVTITSLNLADPARPRKTRVALRGDDLRLGEALGSEPGDASLVTLLDEQAQVTAFRAVPVGNALLLDLTVRSGKETSRLQSTLALRQEAPPAAGAGVPTTMDPDETSPTPR